MNIQFHKNNNLPPLAWCAEVNHGQVSVIHGARVEVNEKWFVEGAWCGDFEKGNFAESDWFCGTGARIEEEKIVFSTPTHVTSSLYSAEVGGGTSSLTACIFCYIS